MDPLINDWTNVAKREKFAGSADARKFLDEWIGRMKPLYMAVSLPYDFMYPDDSPDPWCCGKLSFRPQRRTICPLR